MYLNKERKGNRRDAFQVPSSSRIVVVVSAAAVVIRGRNLSIKKIKKIACQNLILAANGRPRFYARR